MSIRKETTKALSTLLEQYINPHNDSRVYWAKEVTFDYATDHRTRVDYMLFNPLNNTVSGIEHGDFYCYEVKSCLEDFTSGCGLNYLGDYNYLVMPWEVYEQIAAIQWSIGVLCDKGDGKLECVRKARRMNREKSALEMLLMMYRSNQRELNKQREALLTNIPTVKGDGDYESL